MNTIITDAKLPELPDSDIRGKFNNPLYTMADMEAYARAALEAALPHLVPPEAGNPVSVGQPDSLLREVCTELEAVGCGACTGSMAPMEDLHGRIVAYLAAASREDPRP